VTYPFQLPKLPYAYSALEPYFDEATMRLHHDAHHKAYVDKLNAALKDFPQLHHMTGQDAVLPVQTEFPRVAAGVFAYKTPLGEAFGHSGLWFGYKTLVLYFPERKLGAAMQVNSQIDASGADLEVFRMGDKEFTMVEALSQLVLESTASTNGARS